MCSFFSDGKSLFLGPEEQSKERLTLPFLNYGASSSGERSTIGWCQGVESTETAVMGNLFVGEWQILRILPPFLLV